MREVFLFILCFFYMGTMHQVRAGGDVAKLPAVQFYPYPFIDIADPVYKYTSYDRNAAGVDILYHPDHGPLIVVFGRTNALTTKSYTGNAYRSVFSKQQRKFIYTTVFDREVVAGLLGKRTAGSPFIDTIYDLLAPKGAGVFSQNRNATLKLGAINTPVCELYSNPYSQSVAAGNKAKVFFIISSSLQPIEIVDEYCQERWSGENTIKAVSFTLGNMSIVSDDTMTVIPLPEGLAILPVDPGYFSTVETPVPLSPRTWLVPLEWLRANGGFIREERVLKNDIVSAVDFEKVSYRVQEKLKAYPYKSE